MILWRMTAALGVCPGRCAVFDGGGMMEGEQRLIDANAFEEKIEDLVGGTTIGFMLVGALLNAPTIDAVPVVRCKDCRFRGNPLNCPMCHEEEYYDEDCGFDDIVRDKTTDEGYCQKGEREHD